MKLSKKQIRKNRWWKHILSYLPERLFGPDLREIKDYNPELWRGAFERFQSHGKCNLSTQELTGIHPLIEAQKMKEITLTSLAIESMEWWAHNAGWWQPWGHTLQYRKKLDRLTYAAILRTIKKIQQDSLGFFLSHPGIPDETKQRYLAIKFP